MKVVGIESNCAERVERKKTPALLKTNAGSGGQHLGFRSIDLIGRWSAALHGRNGEADRSGLPAMRKPRHAKAV